MSGWPMVKLGEVAKVVSGGTPKTSVPEYWDGGIPWLTPKDLSVNTDLWIRGGARFITDLGLTKSGAVLLPKGTVLWSSRAPIGLVAIADIPVSTNQGFKSFIPSKVLDSVYLAYWLIANRSALQSLGVGATFKEVSGKRAAEMQIPLPPLNEQKRIAEILGAVSDTAKSVDEQLRQAQALRSSLVSFANSLAIEQRPIVEYFDLNCKQPRNIDDDEPTSFIPMSNVDETFGVSPIPSTFSEHKKGYTFFENGDVLLAKITPCFENGKSAIAKLPTRFGHGSTEFHVLHPKDLGAVDHGVSVPLVAAILKESSFLKPAENFMRGSSGHRRIPAWYIEGLKVPVLKKADLKVVDDALVEVDDLLNLYHQKLTLLQELQRSLSARAFAGQL